MLDLRFARAAISPIVRFCITCAILLLGIVTASLANPKPSATPPQTIKPIRGTWLNLFYDDIRYQYTNPKHVDLIAPKAWRTKIREMSELGVKYLILLAVTNDGKAWYESDFMQRVQKPGDESPVSAIMNAADEHDLRVFMSCGWGTNQLADPRKPAIQQVQTKIIEETARRFAGYRSFFGWYFPCEFSAAPHIADEPIQWVNLLAARVRKLTPKAKILISPYFTHQTVADQKYVDQLRKLDVDIIAYQDGVGCAFTTQPQIRGQFARLRWAHNQVPRIAIWGNVESFTWQAEHEYPNYSPLIPAAFPRLLSQMEGVSPYVDETISYTVQGMIDKPGSPLPLGEAIYSAKLGGDYLDYLAGRGRWPLLAASFQDNITHQAVGKPVTFAKPPASQYSKGNLTDGRLGVEDMMRPQWLGFEKSDLDATIDLGESRPIKSLAARFLQYANAGIRLPLRVDFAVSDNGRDFAPATTVRMETWPHDKCDYWIDIAMASNLDRRGRYVRVHAINAGHWLFADELFVNPSVKNY
ncbi:MAG: DUF4434 domain-containing protein [Planctomycetaceae bacterium]|nr:DUF4434 domain-containing protein [Planctomycetaceae bacterium]